MVNVKQINNKFSDKTPERFLPKFDEVTGDRRAVHDSEFTPETTISKRSIDKFKTDVVDWSKNVYRVSGLQSKLDDIYGKNQLVGFVAACPIEQNGHISRAEVAAMEMLGYKALTEDDLTPDGEKKPSFAPEQQYKSCMHVAMACSFDNYQNRHRFLAEQARSYTTPLAAIHHDGSFRDEGYENVRHEHFYREQKSSKLLTREA